MEESEIRNFYELLEQGWPICSIDISEDYKVTYLKYDGSFEVYDFTKGKSSPFMDINHMLKVYSFVNADIIRIGVSILADKKTLVGTSSNHLVALNNDKSVCLTDCYDQSNQWFKTPDKIYNLIAALTSIGLLKEEKVKPKPTERGYISDADIEYPKDYLYGRMWEITEMICRGVG